MPYRPDSVFAAMSARMQRDCAGVHYAVMVV
jgi:hypothetical protein